ncbi:MAG TPA: crossover junction endodeoxyribonuclease RuvC [Gammaproteobacteria bacterium]|nr:crossover junction endodeoxyribonuclease RuvC [Pseudomonadota bacterium]HAY45869.1 crossover junction endodeoxyribonuclease RuvC [Gammaproteobacteria bacterium]
MVPRVLGLDPGSQITGVGIVEQQGTKLVWIAHEAIRLPKGELGERLRVLYERLLEIILQYRPTVMAIEKVFIAKNPHSALVLGHARGVAMLAAVNNGLDVQELAATEIKKSIVGRGRAEKKQVQHMVRVLLSLRESPQEDASDALAAAICQLHMMQMQRAIRGALK